MIVVTFFEIGSTSYILFVSAFHEFSVVNNIHLVLAISVEWAFIFFLFLAVALFLNREVFVVDVENFCVMNLYGCFDIFCTRV